MRLSLRASLVGALALALGGLGAAAYGASDTPTAPQKVHATPANAAVTVAWSKPSSTGGSAITKYVVTATPSKRTCTTSALTCKVTGLKNGVSYAFKVVAYNKHGVGTPSGLSNRATPAKSVARVLVVTPSKGLTNGESVKVSGTGFTPHDTVYLIECQADATGQNGCQAITTLPTAVTISSSGVLATTSFKVATGTIGNGKCGTTAANASSCAVSAGNASGGDSAQAVITFKVP